MVARALPGELPGQPPGICSNSSGMGEQLAEAPSHEKLIEDIRLVRSTGITRLRGLRLPALSVAAHACGRVANEAEVGPPEIEAFLREALADLRDGPFGDAPSVLFGLQPGSRGYPPDDLRTQAASLANVSRSRFRNHQEHIIVDQIAQTILRLCHEHQLRLSALDMERRVPASSRLAVEWMARFEAYYSMWTPIYATAASICAYRSTLLELDRPYDHGPTPYNPDGYTQELQAQGYGSQGLFYLAEYLAEQARFQTRFGGLWLLSSKGADSDIADASFLFRYRSAFSDRDVSYLRTKYHEAGGEMHAFRLFEGKDDAFGYCHDEWQRFLATCSCSWPAGKQPARGHFHTHKTVNTIDESCQPHQMVAAANDYCMIVDDEWDLIADWYHINEPRRRGVDGVVLYEELRERARRQGTPWPP
jgi:hypothetical protein